MANNTDESEVFDVDVTTHGQLPGAADYAQTKIGALGRYTRRPVLHARVKLTRHQDPAVERPVVAQGNLDIGSRFLRAQVEGVNVREAVDRLAERLRQQIVKMGEIWEAKRDKASRPGEWRHGSEPTHRPSYFPRPEEDREIVRRKSFTLATDTVDDAAAEMELLDYDFHLFTEKGTGQDSVLYRDGSNYRIAQVKPVSADQLAPFEVPLTVSEQPAPTITVDEAKQRMALLGLPFLFFVDTDEDHGSVLYHRYDGHYGLIEPAGV